MGTEPTQVIQVKLNGSNYSYWCYLMKVHLTGRKLKGYIDGSNKPPSASDANYQKLQAEWETDNAKVLSWINNSVEPSIGMHFSKFITAKQVWDYLESIYTQSNFARRYELENTIRNLRHDDKSIREFYNMMNGIWDELDLMDPQELTNSNVYQKVREEQKLVQFLMALRAEYEPLRGSVLHRSPLPSVDKILSELVAEETRFKSLSPSTMHTNAVLVTTQKASFRYSPSPSRGYVGKQRISQDECSYCHQKGHWKKDCPELMNRDKGILPTPNPNQLQHNRQMRHPSRLPFSKPVSAFSSDALVSTVDNPNSLSHGDIQEMVAQQVQQLLGTSRGLQQQSSSAMMVTNGDPSNLDLSGSSYREADWDRP